MQNAVAFSNNDVITIAWSFGKKPEGCMGFAIYRIDENDKETPLPSHAVFPGYEIKGGQTTEQFPLQKFYWKDVYARLEAEKTGNRKFRYKIVPLKGSPGKLVPIKELPFIVSNQVEIAAAVSDNVSAYFNRGLISTQRISRVFKGKPNKGSLLKQVAEKGNALRDSLSGDMPEALTTFLDRAKSTGKIYAALYELGDEELIDKLVNLGNRLNIILSDSKVEVADKTKAPVVGADGKKKTPTKKADGNAPAREALENSTQNTWNRTMPQNHIGHNKFLVYVNKTGHPEAVLLGSTNWTPTGLCTQTNNTLIIDDSKLAKRYLDYWKELKKDNEQANGVAKNLQGAALRKWNSRGETIPTIAGIDSLESWFSPNTAGARKSKTTNEMRPYDMEAVVKHINGAKHAILFLAFYPGSPCIANWAAQALLKKKDLFVRGCVTNKSASEGFYYELKGSTPPKKVKGEKQVTKQDPRVFAAEAFDGKVVPEQWLEEILSAGFAIIHDKVMVIDPFSDDCVVITGSHNLGHKASYDNDENLVIVKGNKKLAMAYATHVLDVYDHFAYRYSFKHEGKQSGSFLKAKPDLWLNRYFDKDGKVINKQLNFWMQAAHG